jgi:DNA-binding CsgD family transcriptional regulator
MDEKMGNLFFLNNANNNSKNPLFADSDADAHYKALCTELSQAHTLEEFRERIHHIVKGMGFTDFLFVRLERVWQIGSERGLLHSLPEELMRAYHEEYLYEHDLVIPYGKSNTQPIFSSQIYGYVDDAPFEMELTRKNRLLQKFYRRYRYADHYIIPTPAVNGSGHVQLLLTSADTSKREFQAAITPATPTCRSLCKAIDSITTRKFRSTFIDKNDTPVSMTRKPQHMLRQLANNDMSITELAKEMSISPITAHQHIAAARKALGVNTNIGAVVKALKSGLIQLD